MFFFFYFWSHNSTVTIQIIAFVQIIAQPSSSIFFDVYLEEPRPPYISRGRPEFFDIYIISSELLFEFMKNTTHQKLIFNNVSETRFFETTSLFL